MTLFASLALLNSFEEESQRKWFAKLKVESEMGWNFFSAKDVHSNIKEQWYSSCCRSCLGENDEFRLLQMVISVDMRAR
jgi:hypothetical protein